MPHADRPYLTRPLAGVDQALGEERARPPAELLDQLRERLDRLDGNHPSASARSTADGEQAYDTEPGADEDRLSVRKDGTEPPPDDQPSARGAGESPADNSAGRPAPAVADGAGTGPAADGQYRVAESGPAANDDRYQPWFADQSGAPWFTEQWFAE